MVNQYEDTILKLNQFAWIVCLVIGIIELFTAWWVGGILAIVGAILGKLKVVGPIGEKKFDETWMMLLVCAILGMIGYGAGILFLVQVILIKVGNK